MKTPINDFELKGNSILIIDDNPGNLKLAAEFLVAQGLDVMLAKNGEDGVERAGRGQPALILLDVRMPGLDGYATCAQLKTDAATRDIPVLFLSALDDVADKLKGFAAGGLDYITKPIDEAELLARVSTHLQLSQLRSELAERNHRLVTALDTGNVVNVAVGLLMERHQLTREEAFESIRKQARSRRVKVQLVAKELLECFDQLNLWRSSKTTDPKSGS